MSKLSDVNLPKNENGSPEPLKTARLRQRVQIDPRDAIDFLKKERERARALCVTCVGSSSGARAAMEERVADFDKSIAFWQAEIVEGGGAEPKE